MTFRLDAVAVVPRRYTSEKGGLGRNAFINQSEWLSPKSRYTGQVAMLSTMCALQRGGRLMNNPQDNSTRINALRNELNLALQKDSSVPLDTPTFAAQGPLREIDDFGSNPGRLRMFLRVPGKMPPRPSLVVCLHGCGQTAASYDEGAGWSVLAEKYGFVALFPQQRTSNHMNGCFNWYDADHTQRDVGEAHSIRQMIDHSVATHAIDTSKIFIVGLSAGGSMASSLLAAYPELFAAGAIMAGLPHGSAGNLIDAMTVMSNGRQRTPEQWGQIVRDTTAHPGPWPRLSIWHGSSDNVVSPNNSEASILQWVDLHGVAHAPVGDETIGNHRIRIWRDTAGHDVIEAHTIMGMGHGVPFKSVCNDDYGRAGPFHFDVGVSSSMRILGFFGVLEPQNVTEPNPLIATAAELDPSGVTELTPENRQLSENLRSGVFNTLLKAGVLNKTATGLRRDPPLSGKVRSVITSALRYAGLRRQ